MGKRKAVKQQKPTKAAIDADREFKNRMREEIAYLKRSSAEARPPGPSAKQSVLDELAIDEARVAPILERGLVPGMKPADRKQYHDACELSRRIRDVRRCAETNDTWNAIIFAFGWGISLSAGAMRRDVEIARDSKADDDAKRRDEIRAACQRLLKKKPRIQKTAAAKALSRAFKSDRPGQAGYSESAVRGHIAPLFSSR